MVKEKLPTYEELYQDLVFERNEAIRYLTESGLVHRDHNPKTATEKNRHQSALAYRATFREFILETLNKLHSHDAVEAIYDFEAIDLGSWADTETNRFERELQQLQKIIGKLEIRYDLQYKVIFEYDSEKCTLYVSRNKVMACSQVSQKHRVLTALFSDPHKQWSAKDFDKYFTEQFNRGRYTLEDRSLEKTGNDIKSQVATKTGVNDFLLVSASSLRINPLYVSG